MQENKLDQKWRCMELTEFEFEDILKNAMKAEDEDINALNITLKKKINSKYKYKKLLKSIPVSAVACVMVGFVITSVIYNNKNLKEFPDNSDIVSKPQVTKVSEINEPINSNNVVQSEKNTKKVSPKVKDNSNNVKNISENIPKSDISQNDISQNGISVASEPIVENNEGVSQESEPYTMRRSTDMLIVDYLNEDIELALKIAEIINKQIDEMGDERISKIESFQTQTYQINDNNELIVIFKEGTIAPDELGELRFNVGVIK